MAEKLLASDVARAMDAEGVAYYFLDYGPAHPDAIDGPKEFIQAYRRVYFYFAKTSLQLALGILEDELEGVLGDV